MTAAGPGPLVFPHADVTRVAPIHQNAGGAAIGTIDNAISTRRPGKVRKLETMPSAPPVVVAIAAPPMANPSVRPNEDHSIAKPAPEMCLSRKTSGTDVNPRSSPIGRATTLEVHRLLVGITIQKSS